MGEGLAAADVGCICAHRLGGDLVQGVSQLTNLVLAAGPPQELQGELQRAIGGVQQCHGSQPVAEPKAGRN